MNSIEIKISDDITLIAEPMLDNDFAEIMVFLKDSNNAIIQDLARIGQCLKYDDKLQDLVKIPEQYYVKVYADPDVEDFTDEFFIDEYKEGNI